jgi:hypothetical protein
VKQVGRRSARRRPNARCNRRTACLPSPAVPRCSPSMPDGDRSHPRAPGPARACRRGDRGRGPQRTWSILCARACARENTAPRARARLWWTAARHPGGIDERQIRQEADRAGIVCGIQEGSAFRATLQGEAALGHRTREMLGGPAPAGGRQGGARRPLQRVLVARSVERLGHARRPARIAAPEDRPRS